MKTKTKRSRKARTIVTYHGRVPAYQREIENLEDEIQKLKRTRLPDSQFPMYMDKQTASDYIGFSVKTLENAIQLKGLSIAVEEIPHVQKVWLNKLKVNRWLEEGL